MLTLNNIRTNRSKLIEGLKTRNFDDGALRIVDDVIELDDRRKSNQTHHDSCLAEINKYSKEIGELYQSGRSEEAETIKGKVAQLKAKAQTLDNEKREISKALEELLLAIPNIPHPTVPKGKSEEDNEIIQSWSEDLPSGTNALPHWELAKKYGIIDFEAGVKISGSGFPLYRGKGARLERALINFFLDEAIAMGYEEIIPPLIVNANSAMATGQLPDKEGQMYHITEDDLYLIPTAEVPVTNIYRNVIISENEFPIKLTGYTPCFRREAGSYGADVKGLNRVHQFDKVEIVQIADPRESYKILDEMVEHVKLLLAKLELPYRILRLCGGDLSFTSALTYDFEVYSMAQEKWLEVSSVSNFETYQMLKVRSALVPAVQASSRIQQLLFMGFILGVGAGAGMIGNMLMIALVVTFGVTALFALVTLPVEFDASRRALVWLDNTGTTQGSEYDGAKDALWWAAMTYVAGALSALVMFLYFFLTFMGNE